MELLSFCPSFFVHFDFYISITFCTLSDCLSVCLTDCLPVCTYMTITHLPVERAPPLVVLNKESYGGQDLWYPNIPGVHPRQLRPSVGDSLTNDTSSPDVTRGRLEASISGSGQMLFQSTRDR